MEIPQAKTAAGVQKYLSGYVIIAQSAAIVFLTVGYLNLQGKVYDLFDRVLKCENTMKEATRTTESFLNYQRFVTPIRAFPEPLPVPDVITPPGVDTGR